MDSLTDFEEDEAFFRSGEALVHEGEPSRMRSLAPVELELESASRLVTPEQLARAARFRKPVALLVGGLGLLSLLALATHRQQGVESFASAELTSEHALEPPAAQAAAVASPEPPPTARNADPVAVPSAELMPLAAPEPAEPAEPPASSNANALSSPASSPRLSTLSTAKRASSSLREPPVALPALSSGASLPSSARFPDLPR